MRQSKPARLNNPTLDDVLDAVNGGFNQMEQRFVELKNDVGGRLDKMDNRLNVMDGRLDRIEKTIDKWPPPSYITDLLERVSKIEHFLKLKSKVH